MLPKLPLDDRTYESILQEARQGIQRRLPEWTDENAHDPGMTMLELFAWISEMQQFYLSRVPDRNRRKFLELLGESPPAGDAGGCARFVRRHPGDGKTAAGHEAARRGSDVRDRGAVDAQAARRRPRRHAHRTGSQRPYGFQYAGRRRFFTRSARRQVQAVVCTCRSTGSRRSGRRSN
ncbi:hypothetical protein [Cohnella rhizosphaerae]|uniref:Uncharacterized protein n=1 Tax=Cohnella rhizosphaerae TaxID=1457232 RepID=A0A9X4QVU5_9BACL|nr:hypothetical protein [Cohnella rhizosphaerae]MDG0812939.1 hypothetical protein [Cohnella rhizosphaerae]